MAATTPTPREDWLLLLLGFKGAGPSAALDPVRVQKGMFLLSEESSIPRNECYAFKPYNWGPYSRQLRMDLNRLMAEGYVQGRDVAGYSWKEYALTPAGVERARDLLRRNPDVAREVSSVKKKVSEVSFNQLLDEVYTDYPEYAKNSLFRS